MTDADKSTYKQLVYPALGACQEVHKHLGPFLNEYMYQDALAIELSLRGIPFDKEFLFTADYKGHTIEHRHFADFRIMNGDTPILIGLNFSTTTRRPDGWVVERGDGSVVAQGGHDGGHDSGHDVDMMKELVLAIGDASKSREELAKAVDISSRGYFQDNYLTPALRYGYIARTLPDKPKSKNQRYYLTDKGIELLKQLTQ